MPGMNIGKVIRALRTERGDSLEKLAFEVKSTTRRAAARIDSSRAKERT